MFIWQKENDLKAYEGKVKIKKKNSLAAECIRSFDLIEGQNCTVDMILRWSVYVEARKNLALRLGGSFSWNRIINLLNGLIYLQSKQKYYMIQFIL